MNSQEYNEEKAAKKVERAEAKTAKASRAVPNRQERRAAVLRGRRLNKAMKHFSRLVFAHSEELRSLDDETPRSEQKKVYAREARRLVNNKTVEVPRKMIENGLKY
jgi:hypothetical protein